MLPKFAIWKREQLIEEEVGKIEQSVNKPVNQSPGKYKPQGEREGEWKR